MGDPLEPTPPFIRQALIDALDPISQYPTVVGQPRLREAVAGWAERRLGVRLDPATQVLPAAGSKEAIFHLPLVLLGPDERRRRVVYPSPSYPVYAGSARFAQGVPQPVPLREDNGYRLELGELPAEVLAETRIAWINYPHNPTGASVDAAYLQRQLEVAREHDILLCSDDCYLDLYFDESTRRRRRRSSSTQTRRAERRLAVEAVGDDRLPERLHRRRSRGDRGTEAGAAQLRRGVAELRPGGRRRRPGPTTRTWPSGAPSSAPSAIA